MLYYNIQLLFHVFPINSVTKEGMKYSAVMESIAELDEKSCGKILVRCIKHSNPKCKRNKEILMDYSKLGWVVTSRGEKVRRKYRRIRATELLQNKRKEIPTHFYKNGDIKFSHVLFAQRIRS